MGADSPRSWSVRELAARLDHTCLAPTAIPSEIDSLCEEARAYGMASVCVHGTHVARCALRLEGSLVRVACVVGFPLGANATQVKVEEARLALGEGARELDLVLQIGALKAGDFGRAQAELERVVDVCEPMGATLKVILETGLLTEAEVVQACRLSEQAGAHFVKTSTGFGPRGATVEDVVRMRASVTGRIGVKAAGGIRTAEQARLLLEAGATRLGTSASLAILREWRDLAARTRAGA